MYVMPRRGILLGASGTGHSRCTDRSQRVAVRAIQHALNGLITPIRPIDEDGLICVGGGTGETYNTLSYVLGPTDDWMHVPATTLLSRVQAASAPFALAELPAPADIAQIQTALAVPADGALGPQTAAALDAHLPTWRDLPMSTVLANLSPAGAPVATSPIPDSSGAGGITDQASAGIVSKGSAIETAMLERQRRNQDKRGATSLNPDGGTTMAQRVPPSNAAAEAEARINATNEAAGRLDVPGGGPMGASPSSESETPQAGGGGSWWSGLSMTNKVAVGAGGAVAAGLLAWAAFGGRKRKRG